LGFLQKGGAQRVQNWKKRGIPAQVKLDWPEIFMAQAVRTPTKAATELAEKEAAHDHG